jgi:hypothetical protein
MLYATHSRQTNCKNITKVSSSFQNEEVSIWDPSKNGKGFDYTEMILDGCLCPPLSNHGGNYTSMEVIIPPWSNEFLTTAKIYWDIQWSWIWHKLFEEVRDEQMKVTSTWLHTIYLLICQPNFIHICPGWNLELHPYTCNPEILFYTSKTCFFNTTRRFTLVSRLFVRPGGWERPSSFLSLG